MTDKEKLKQAINTLKEHCIENHTTMSENPCGACMFEDCCMNRRSDYNTLEQLMEGLLKDMVKIENIDFGAAYDAVERVVCNNFEECKSCPFYNCKDDCPLGQLGSVVVPTY